jgi:hypothetical protein
MYEPFHVRKEGNIKKEEFERRDLLKNFMMEAGKTSLERKNKIKVPIQAVVREPIKKFDLDFSNLLPKHPSIVEDDKKRSLNKALPILPEKPRICRLDTKRAGNLNEGLQVKKLPKLTDKKIDITKSRIFERNGELYYQPINNVKFKKYGNIDPLIFDKDVMRIVCIDNKIFVDYKNHKHISTDLEFKKQKDVNKLIKKFAKETNTKISKDQPILNSKLPEGFIVHANYGTKFVPASFVLVRE